MKHWPEGRSFSDIVSFLIVVLIVLMGRTVFCADPVRAPIHFTYKAIPFTLDSSQTPQKHAPEAMAGGVAVFDYDNDGNLDIFFTNGADIHTLKKESPKYSNRLFQNNGDGTFTDVTEKAGLAGTGYDVGVAVGDYDNDGCKDLFVAGVYRNTLYHNNCNGTFTDVSDKAGINHLDKDYGPLWSVGAAWVDVNNDGLLDLLVVNYMKWDIKTEQQCGFSDDPQYCHPNMYKPLPNQLFVNKGNGVFDDVSAPAGIRAHPGKGMGVAVADFDGTERPDIFVSNDKVVNSFFRNRGNIHFDEAAFEAGVSLPDQGAVISGMGVDAGDLNNDGFPDIVLVALDHETFPIYKNDGKGTFTEVTAETGMALESNPMSGYSPNIADFDNDGWKDIFVSRGDVQSSALATKKAVAQPNTIFRNVQGKSWTALTQEAGFGDHLARHRGSAYGDFNHDGKLDIAVTAIGSPAEIWMNGSPNANHWIEIQLEGTKSNRDGIRAKIRVTAGGMMQFVQYSTASGYASSSAGPVHFGLASAKKVDEVEIRWPSGTVQVIKDVPADQVVRVKEGK
ncbi:MAG: CRTAC1 family protein [Terriglobales bacterium]